MVLFGALVVLAGYTVTWAGALTLRGCKPSFAELVIPGRYQGCHDATQGNPTPTYAPSAPGGAGAPSGGSAPPDVPGQPAPGFGIQGPGGNVTGARR